MMTSRSRMLFQAINTLQLEQGRIARRNARRRVLGAVKQLLRAMDEEYPAIKSNKPNKPRKRRLLRARWRELLSKGWVQVIDHELIGLAGELKLPIKHTPAGTWDTSQDVEVGGAVWIPGWVAHYAPNKSQLLLARKNATMIQAANAAIRLGSLQNKITRGDIVCPKVT